MMGLRELALLAVVVLVLYGRSGVLKSRRFQTLWPWISPQRRAARPAQSARDQTSIRRSAASAAAVPSSNPARSARLFLLEGNRLFWFLTVLAATAVAALVVVRVLIISGAGPGLGR
jgi:hypothetical protein